MSVKIEFSRQSILSQPLQVNILSLHVLMGHILIQACVAITMCTLSSVKL